MASTIVGESSDANHHNGLMEKLKLTMKDTHFNWFDLRVFYLRISSFQVDDSVPEYLALRLIPIEPENLLQSNSNSFDGFSSILRLDRADRRSEEATFVGTNSVRLTRGVKFEVSSQESLILRGVLEMCKRDGSSMVMDQWRITDCEYRAVGFGNGSSRPAMEIYIAGSHAGEPVVLTETLDLDALQSRNDDLQMNLTEFENEEHNCKFILKKTENSHCEDGELSWFSAGVRVGVEISLSTCMVIGIGVGLIIGTIKPGRSSG